MDKQKSYRFETQVIHAAQSPRDWQGATLPPIYQTASHAHATAENLSQTFAGKTTDHIYMRLTNPTNRTLEQKLAVLEGGQGAVVMASGMAAVANACMALLRAGDELVTGNSLFMSTYLLFANVFKKYGITARFVEPTDLTAVEGAINDRTRFIYLETIGNPKMDVPDLADAAEVAHRHGMPLMVDSTLATPYLCRPLELGADVVIHSTTKYLSGHGVATGGVVIDGGRFPWDIGRFPDFKPFIDRKGPLAFLDKVWREHHINFGTTQPPLHSYLTMIGLDTLALRMESHWPTPLAWPAFCRNGPKSAGSTIPGLMNTRPITRPSQLSGKGSARLLTFGLKDQDACFGFINRLQLIYHLANLGDCKTLVIHPCSSQYVSFDEPTRQELSITPDLHPPLRRHRSPGGSLRRPAGTDPGMSEYIEHDQEGISVGLVKKKFFTFAEPPARDAAGKRRPAGPITLAYETYGELNRDEKQRRPDPACPLRRLPCGRLLPAGRPQARLVGQSWSARARGSTPTTTSSSAPTDRELHGLDRPCLSQPRDRPAVRTGLSGGHHRRHGAGPEGPDRPPRHPDGSSASWAGPSAACRSWSGPSAIRTWSPPPFRWPPPPGTRPWPSPSTRWRARPSWPTPTGSAGTTTTVPSRTWVWPWPA